MLYGPGIDNFGVGLFPFEEGPLSLRSLPLNPVSVGLLIPTSLLSLSVPSSVELSLSLSRSNIECAVSKLVRFKLVVDPGLGIGLALPGRLGKVFELPFLGFVGR